MTVMLLQNNVSYGNTTNNNSNGNNNNLPKDTPAIIEEEYRQKCNGNSKNIELNGSRPRLNVFSLPYSGGPPRRQGKAMNYYRLWIYTCNIVLMVSVLGFIIVSTQVALLDSRRKLIPGLSLSHPSLLYAYLALLTQSGLLQLLGCIGALKLNERLLNLYWLMLLFLLVGDAMLGVVWIFRFDTLYKELGPILKERLKKEYAVDLEFTETWDNLQKNLQCCGVEGPEDYNDIDRVVFNKTEVFIDPLTIYVADVPVSCCRVLKEELPEEKPVTEIEEITNKLTTIQQRLLNKKNRERRNTNKKKFATGISAIMRTCAETNGYVAGSVYGVTEVLYFTKGCDVKLREWLRDAAHILGVLGYCVIAFLKLCFLGILRYEIREMVQKIKLLQEQAPPVLMLSEPNESAPRLCNHTDVVVRRSSATKLFNNDTGNDSDTNSHCALLIENTPGVSNAETHELQDMYVQKSPM